MPLLRPASLVIAAVTTALIAGFFFAYAVSVARGLALLPDAEYVAAMQAINDTARTPLFALAFFGALVALPVAAAAGGTVRAARGRWLLAAAALYAVGGFGVTFAANVPLNDELALLDLAGAPAGALAAARADYEDAWNAWNAVRTIASTVAVACVALAALSPPTPRRAARRAGSRRGPTP